MIANCSGGVEPLFSLVFMRNIMDGTQLIEANDVFGNYAKEHGFYSDSLMKQILKDGTIMHNDDVPKDAKAIFVTAHDISPYWHVKMQSAFQLHTDNAVSKTVNFEENATLNDIEDAYILAYNENLKGITVYRNNSRLTQPMNLEKKDTPKIEEFISNENQVDKEDERKCPECGSTINMAEGCFVCPNCGFSGCS